jgi:hypothetical protein
MPKPKREIVEPGVVVGDTKFKPGDEAALAKVAPQWNIDQMVAKGWLTGDWSNVGLTPEEEAEVAEETQAAAAAGSARTGRKNGR